MKEALRIKRKHEAMDKLNFHGDNENEAMLRELAHYMEANVQRRHKEEAEKAIKSRARMGYYIARMQGRVWRVYG